MDITREMIMALPVEQASKLYKTVVAFLENNLDAVLDAGLLDEVLYNEYKAGVVKLFAGNCDQQKTNRWLMLSLMAYGRNRSKQFKCGQDGIGLC